MLGTPSQTGTATINVNIVDANDNAPMIKDLPHYQRVVPAGATQGDRVYCFSAEEPDMSLSPSFSFTYLCNSAHCRDFELQPTNR